MVLNEGKPNTVKQQQHIKKKVKEVKKGWVSGVTFSATAFHPIPERRGKQRKDIGHKGRKLKVNLFL